MRKIPAFIAAVFCSLTLSGGTLARDPVTITHAADPSWLQFRAAFAAEDLWPKRQAKLRASLADNDGTTSLNVPIAQSYQQATKFLHDWVVAATRAAKGEEPEYDLAEN